LNTKINADCSNLGAGDLLLVGTGGPAAGPTVTPGPSPTPAPPTITPTPFAGTTEICVLLFDDLNGDAQRITQVLVNFASNAVKFTEQGTISLRAKKIGETESGCLVRFEVQDTGIGLDEAGIACLFQPFQQIDMASTRQYEGTGLGLAICRQLAGLMPEGEVGVDSMPGLGSTFWFNVRLAKSCQSCRHLDVLPGQAQYEELDCAQTAMFGTHILLAEDNVFNQQVVTDLLENTGAVVRVASNGKEAVELLQRHHFDCVLMDMQMPVMNGLEATRLIRANPALLKLPVIAMTANTTIEARELCLSSGMNDFISKPFEADNFYKVIASCLTGVPPSLAALNPGNIALSAQDSSAQTVIDFSVLHRLCAGNSAKMYEYALKFLTSACLDMAEVDDALKRLDLPGLGRLAHHISGAAGMAGAKQFADLCKILQIDCADGESPSQLRDIVTQMHTMLGRINEEIAEIITPLP